MRPPYGPIPLVTIACVSYAVMESFEVAGSAWLEILNGFVGLRCWWAEPKVREDDIEWKSSTHRAYIVLPEVFGLNAWVRSVVDRLVVQGLSLIHI